MGPAWSAAAAAQAQAAADAIDTLADASRSWQSAVSSAFVSWAMPQAQADADFGIAAAIAGATAGKAAAAAGSMFSAAASKAAGDLTRLLNAVQTGFVDAATAASVKSTKAIAAAETVERKAVAKADVVLAQDLQSAWGTYAAAERSAVTLNARERATIGADFKKDVAGAELAAVKAVAPARKTSMVAAAEANGVYHVKVTGIVADLGILGGEIKVEQVNASHSLISPATLKKWLDVLSTCGDLAAAFGKGLAQGAANLGNAVQNVGVGILNVPAASVNFGSWASENLFFAVPEHMKIRLPYILSPDWSKGVVTQESDFDHNVSKGCLGFAATVLGPGAIGKLEGTAVGIKPLSMSNATGAYLPGATGGGSGLGLFENSSARVSQKGLELISDHLSRFGACEQNTMMMQRLRSLGR
ncbi:MAG: hypothetical protein EXS06_10380 [Planctomycetaceae bacterium]|nr:hypothetical protein [Planctomycetaceae bacterium]